jgi:uncharacterized protein (DUF488 family)
MEKERIIYTIGHSSRAFESFVEMLLSFQIGMVVDVRRFPGSRKYPQYNQQELQWRLAEHTIDYLHLENLGGRRKAVPESKHTAWRHPAFRGYADYMDTTPFKEGIKTLEEAGMKFRIAYMCSEAVWWRCHRSMVSDYLKSLDWQVWHIMDVGKAKEHPYTAPAKIVNGKLCYTS